MLTACATPTPPADVAVQSFRAIGYSVRDTCTTQREIAAHNSVYDTLKTGKAVVYQAPCERGKKAKPQPREAKTS